MSSQRSHWPEYGMEAAGLGLLMVSICGFALLLFHPDSQLVNWVDSGYVRRGLMGLAVGVTLIALIYSPWGKRSGAHFNPAVTLAFFRLGKVDRRDALFYIIFQTLGAIVGALLMCILFSRWMQDPEVNYVATIPGSSGVLTAWITEFFTSLLLMFILLIVSNSTRFARWTGCCVGLIIAVNILLLAPLSGMSLNPSRTLASAVPSGIWIAIWVYFTAPPLGMLAAAQGYLWWKGHQGIFCAKLHHDNSTRCIFCEIRNDSAAQIVSTLSPIREPVGASTGEP